MNALFINYEWCSGCHTCEVACKVEHNLPEGQFGIKLVQDGPRKLPNGKWEYINLPIPTSLCDLCEERVTEGRLRKCVHHCQAGIMNYGTVEEMSELAAEHPNSVIFTLDNR